jgi:hypothetical protein
VTPSPASVRAGSAHGQANSPFNLARKRPQLSDLGNKFGDIPSRGSFEFESASAAPDISIASYPPVVMQPDPRRKFRPSTCAVQGPAVTAAARSSIRLNSSSVSLLGGFTRKLQRRPAHLEVVHRPPRTSKLSGRPKRAGSFSPQDLAQIRLQHVMTFPIHRQSGMIISWTAGRSCHLPPPPTVKDTDFKAVFPCCIRKRIIADSLHDQRAPGPGPPAIADPLLNRPVWISNGGSKELLRLCGRDAA